jgi:phospholipase C
MGYFTEEDIPFHRALAQAFTICDNYHCSIQGPTIPNRLYLWTGTIDPAGTAGGPATWNPADYQPVYSWTTYPERLQAAGVSWQVYANNEVGDGSDGWVGDYGDNPLWLFEQYHAALASTDPAVQQLALRANLNNGWLPDSGLGPDVDHVLSEFLTTCAAGTLPQVSWVVAPQDYSEHPSARPADGAAYVEAVLQGIWGNPELRDSTVVFLNYDENDGFFDHLAPPLPPAGTPGEFLPASQPLTDGFPPAFGSPTPIGLGPRVPMTVISPWSQGGWVSSEVFDHTSVLRFLETWTGVAEPNISAWRRSVCGDLTSCFDFSSFNVTVPSLPDANALRATADQVQPTLPTPTTPALGQQVTPVQDPGTAPARPLPYQPVANLTITSVATMVATNQGTQSVHLSVYPDNILPVTPQQFDVAPGAQAVATAGLDGITGAYDVWVYGPNGFSVHGTGNVLTTAVGVEAALSVVGPANHPEVELTVTNAGSSAVTVLVTELDGDISAFTVAAGGQQTVPYDPLSDNQGWYDFTVEVDNHPNFVRQYTGHLENGQPSVTG